MILFTYFIFIASMFGLAFTWHYIKKYRTLGKDIRFLELQMKCLSVTAILAASLLVMEYLLLQSSEPVKIAVKVAMPDEITTVVDAGTGVTVAEDFYGVGQYKVGKDIPAGQYVAIGDGYIEIAIDSSGDFSKIAMNDHVTNRRYATVNDGEYLKITQNLKLYPVESAPASDVELTKIPAGQYKVGVDIPAGEYKVRSFGNGYYEVSRNDRRSIVTNGVMQDGATAYVTVSNGQYLKIVRAEMQLQ